MKKTFLAFLLVISLCLSGCSIEFTLCDHFLHRTSHDNAISTEPVETYAPIAQDRYLATYRDPATNRDMDYHMYIPQNATENMPLIVYLHGLGAVGPSKLNEDNPLIQQAMDIYGDEYPFLILAPSSMLNKSWLSKELPARVKSLIDYIADLYHVDRNKIIITGHSMGAAGVMRQIELYGDFYSAAIPVSLPTTKNLDIEKYLDVPIWGFIGGKEAPINYYMQVMFEEMNEIGCYAIFTELEGVEHGKSALYAYMWDVFEWAISQ